MTFKFISVCVVILFCPVSKKTLKVKELVKPVTKIERKKITSNEMASALTTVAIIKPLVQGRVPFSRRLGSQKHHRKFERGRFWNIKKMVILSSNACVRIKLTA